MELAGGGAAGLLEATIDSPSKTGSERAGLAGATVSVLPGWVTGAAVGGVAVDAIAVAGVVVAAVFAAAALFFFFFASSIAVLCPSNLKK